jgi:hypothetical protein
MALVDFWLGRGSVAEADEVNSELLGPIDRI